MTMMVVVVVVSVVVLMVVVSVVMAVVVDVSVVMAMVMVVPFTTIKSTLNFFMHAIPLCQCRFSLCQISISFVC